MYRGDFALGKTFDFKFTTVDTYGVPATLSSSPVVSIYADNSTTEITAGITLSVDFDSRTGLNNVRVVATSGNGYATATNYQVVITTGTVASLSVVGYVVAEFSIENRSALRPTTPDRTLDVSAGGEAGIDWSNIGSPTTAQNLSATNIDVDQVVASVSGAVGSVTARVTANVDQVDGAALTAHSSGKMPSDVLAINSGLTNGNNATLSLKALDVQNSAGSAVTALSSNPGSHGIVATGNGAGFGIAAQGGATGHGIYAQGGATSGAGIWGQGQGSAAEGIVGNGGTDGDGIAGYGNSIGSGISATGGATGDGFDAIGGATSGNAIHAQATDGDGIQANGAGTGVDIRGDITGNITGNLSGSAGSVTGNLGGNVVGNVNGSVGSVVGNVGGNVTGSVGSVVGNVGGNVTGSIGSLAAQAKADVNAEVVDVVSVDTWAQPGQATPSATPTMAEMQGYLYKAWRNKTSQTAAQYSLFNDDAATVDQKATFADNGTTATRGEVATGP